MGIVLAGALLLFVLEGRPWHAVFDTVSSLTTTGFSLEEPAGWSTTRKFFTTLLMLVGGGALVLAGFAPQDAFFESASAIGTVGLSSGITDAGLPASIKLLLSFEMWAGRLEILPVLVLLYPGTWKLRKSSR